MGPCVHRALGGQPIEQMAARESGCAGDERNARHQISEAAAVSAAYRPSGNSSTPAGIETNERTTGVNRPRKTAQSPFRSNQSSARSS